MLYLWKTLWPLFHVMNHSPSTPPLICPSGALFKILPTFFMWYIAQKHCDYYFKLCTSCAPPFLSSPSRHLSNFCRYPSYDIRFESAVTAISHYASSVPHPQFSIPGRGHISLTFFMWHTVGKFCDHCFILCISPPTPFSLQIIVTTISYYETPLCLSWVVFHPMSPLCFCPSRGWGFFKFRRYLSCNESLKNQATTFSH